MDLSAQGAGNSRITAYSEVILQVPIRESIWPSNARPVQVPCSSLDGFGVNGGSSRNPFLCHSALPSFCHPHSFPHLGLRLTVGLSHLGSFRNLHCNQETASECTTGKSLQQPFAAGISDHSFNERLAVRIRLGSHPELCVRHSRPPLLHHPLSSHHVVLRPAAWVRFAICTAVKKPAPLPLPTVWGCNQDA
jgi:hypothetical protein